jgi:hypothetical protein
VTGPITPEEWVAAIADLSRESGKYARVAIAVKTLADLRDLHRMRAAARHIIDNHPEPEAVAAAMRILNERTPT